MFGDLGIGALNMLAGHAQPVEVYRIIDFRDDIALLDQWGQVCRSEFRWQPEWGVVHLVASAKHPTPAAANAEAARLALSSGYAVPRWWEFWRWTEGPLPQSLQDSEV